MLLTIAGLPIWEDRWDVDLNSGRLAREGRLLGFQVQMEIEDTEVSKTAEPAGWISTTPDWHYYNRRSYFSLVVEKNAYYWVPQRLADAEKAWKAGEFSHDAKRESARRFLRSDPWGSYAIQIQKLAESHPKGGKPVEISDLPPISAR